MLKSKRFNASMAAVVVLAVVLAITLTAGITLAWFASNDNGSTQFTMGGAVEVSLQNSPSNLVAGSGKLATVTIPAAKVVPGMQLMPSVYADITSSTTSALLRAKVDITVANGGTTSLPSGWSQVTAEGASLGKYSNTADGSVGLVVVDTIAEANQYVVKSLLQSELVRTANGWYYDATSEYFYFVGNGASYSQVMSAAAVLNTTGETTTYATYASAGTLLSTLDVTTEASASDIYTAFHNKTTGGVADDGALVGTSQVASVVTGALKADNSPYNADFFTEGTLSTAKAHVPFLVRLITLPTSWTDEQVAGATITIDISFEAVQDYLIDLTVTGDEHPATLTTLAYAIPVFNDALGD